VELVADVVVVMDVVARARERVAARPVLQGAREPAQQRAARLGLRGGAIDRLEQRDEITLDLDATLAVEIPEPEMRIAHEREGHATVGEADRCDGLPARRCDALPIREHERNRRIAERPEQASNEPPLGGTPARFPRPEALLRRVHGAFTPAGAEAGTGVILMAIFSSCSAALGTRGPACRPAGPWEPRNCGARMKQSSPSGFRAAT